MGYLSRVETEAARSFSNSAEVAEDLGQLSTSVFPRLNRYITHLPFPKQAAFLLLPQKEAFYGGQAGGGKSDALLMGALQYVDVPGYSALILRRSFKDLNKKGAIMDRAIDWLVRERKTDAKWRAADHRFDFPNGSSLTFGYLESTRDLEQYQSSEFQFIGWDELTQHPSDFYKFMFSRLRGPSCPLHDGTPGAKKCVELAHVPQRVRSASNPGGPGHEWVKERFITHGLRDGRPFIPAGLDENPYVDKKQYLASMEELTAIQYAQLRHGDWDASITGGLFKEEFFKRCYVDTIPGNVKLWRRWDLAASEPTEEHPNPDFAAGGLGGYDPRTKIFYVADVRAKQARPGVLEQLMKDTAEDDGPAVPILVEQEPGAAGKIVVASVARMLDAYRVYGDLASGNKMRAIEVIAGRAERGYLRFLRAPWNKELIREGALIDPNKEDKNHNDRWDTLARLYGRLSKPGRAGAWGRGASTADRYPRAASGDAGSRPTLHSGVY